VAKNDPPPSGGRQTGAAGTGLSTARIVREAIELADRDGVDSLSMRRLATELGTGAMSLYHYVANKEQLLDAMVDALFEEIELPREELGWPGAIRSRAISARTVLARHPWAIGLMDARTSPGPANLRHHEAVAAALRRSGFGVAAATHANWLLDSYVYGFALQEASLPVGDGETLEGVVEQVYLPQLPESELPFLREAALELAASGFDVSEEFLLGLDLVLTALEALRESSGES